MPEEIAIEALRDLVATIEACGGVTKDRKGLVVPVADMEWPDLGDSYLKACNALGLKPLLRDDSEESCHV